MQVQDCTERSLMAGTASGRINAMTSISKSPDQKVGTVTALKSEGTPAHQSPPPAAGAHAASHLTNEDATPGSGALTSRANASGREVDGGAG